MTGTFPIAERSPQSLSSLFFEFTPEVVTEPRTIFRELKKGAAPFCQVIPGKSKRFSKL